jgi:MoaA/NifB/PqqE/SkfB family radical SAM enzyme
MNKALRFLKNVFFISPSIPSHIDIEISTACNLSCKMCKRETIDFGNKLMPYERYIEIVNRLPKGVQMLSFGGYGEMLLHPRFNEMVRYAKTKGFFTQTTSNGTLLTTEERVENLIQSGLDEFRISVDHIKAPLYEPEVGHVFSEKLLANIDRLSAKKKKLNSSMQIGMNTVVQLGNFDSIIEMIRFAERLGLDFVELIRLDTCGNLAKRTLSFAKEKELYQEIDRMKKKIRVATPSNRLAGIRRLYNLRQEYCPFRLKSAHIRMSGAVTPCSFGFGAHDLGNILTTDLKTIWKSAPFQAIRRNDKNPTCQSCTIFKWKDLDNKR